LGYIFPRFRLRDLAEILLGLVLESLMIPLSIWGIKNQNRSISGQRLFWERTLLIPLVVSVICFIFYSFQYRAIKDLGYACNFSSPNRHIFVAGLKLCDDFVRAMLLA
jgi:hypothetical protein